MEKRKNISSVGIMLLLYITLWSCNNNAIILYGGYGLLMFFTISKLFFSEKGAVIEMYTSTKQLFIFMCFCFASIFWANSAKLAFEKAIFIFACVLLVIVMTNYFVRKKSIDILLFTIAAMGIVMAAYVIFSEGGLSGFYQKATSSIGASNVNAARVGGDINNQNFIGIQCAYSAVVLFYYGMFEKRAVAYIVALIPSVVTVASGSKTAFITLVIGVLLIMYYNQKRQHNIQKYLKVLIGVIILGIVIRLILSLDIMYTISKRLELFFSGVFGTGVSRSDASTNLRLNMIIVGLKQFFQTPVLGIGLGNAAVLNAVKLNFPAYSHCDYVEHLVNGGFIGFLLYYRIFVYFVKNYSILLKRNSDSRNVISFITLILLLIQNMSDVSYYNSITTYLFFILWTAQIEIKREEAIAGETNKENSGQTDNTGEIKPC